MKQTVSHAAFPFLLPLSQQQPRNRRHHNVFLVSVFLFYFENMTFPIIRSEDEFLKNCFTYTHLHRQPFLGFWLCEINVSSALLNGESHVESQLPLNSDWLALSIQGLSDTTQAHWKNQVIKVLPMSEFITLLSTQGGFSLYGLTSGSSRVEGLIKRYQLALFKKIMIPFEDFPWICYLWGLLVLVHCWEYGSNFSHCYFRFVEKYTTIGRYVKNLSLCPL